MISVSAPTFDLDGFVQIDPDEESPAAISRRVTRSRTLDGGVVMTDGGYSDGDITLEYVWQTVSRTHNDAVAYLLQNYPLVVVATEQAVYLAAPEFFEPGPEESSFRLLVKEALS